MNIRVKAGLITAGMLAVSTGGILVLELIVHVLTANQIMMLAGAGLVGVLIYILYGINLNRLEYEQKIKEITDKN
jgi:hypothetical protein